MKIQLNARLSKDLRSAVNDSQNFSLRKTAEFHCPSDKKGDKSEKRAYNCICAAIDRIDDLVEYLNNLDIEPTKDATCLKKDFRKIIKNTLKKGYAVMAQ